MVALFLRVNNSALPSSPRFGSAKTSKWWHYPLCSCSKIIKNTLIFYFKSRFLMQVALKQKINKTSLCVNLSRCKLKIIIYFSKTKNKTEKTCKKFDELLCRENFSERKDSSYTLNKVGPPGRF
ncbi:hypothetical protein, partial [Enterococcus faecalis]|uniref:hypothetical protein n=2 Tax=Bacteria TaxID=2 RepID=UPI002456BB26